MEFDWKLNANKAQAILQLFDLAVKAQGLQVAEAAVVLSKELRDLAEAAAKAAEAPKVAEAA